MLVLLVTNYLVSVSFVFMNDIIKAHRYGYACS